MQSSFEPLGKFKLAIPDMKSIPEMATFSASEDISGHSASSNDTQSQECLSRQEISDLSPGKCGISRLAPDETTLKDSPSPSTNVRVNVQAKAVDGKTAGFDSSEDGSKGRRRAESTKKRKISKENRAQEKRRKLESSLNSRKKMMQNPLSPCVTPRRKDSSDLLGFVSLSLAPPRGQKYCVTSAKYVHRSLIVRIHRYIERMGNFQSGDYHASMEAKDDSRGKR